MRPKIHPIATLALSALRREGETLTLDASGAARLREALERRCDRDLRGAIVEVVEIAYVVERDRGAVEAAEALRSLAAEFTAPLAAENQRRDAGEQRQRARFARFSGQARPARPAGPSAPAPGGLRVADLRPRRTIHAR